MQNKKLSPNASFEIHISNSKKFVFYENFRIPQMMAHQKVREKTILSDETTEVKQALVWKILYDGAEDKRDIVLKMSRAELNAALVRCPIWQKFHKTFASFGMCIEKILSYDFKISVTLC